MPAGRRSLVRAWLPTANMTFVEGVSGFDCLVRLGDQAEVVGGAAASTRRSRLRLGSSAVLRLCVLQPRMPTAWRRDFVVNRLPPGVALSTLRKIETGQVTEPGYFTITQLTVGAQRRRSARRS